MAVVYAFEGNVFRMNLEGVYPPQEIIDAFDRAMADPRFPKNARFLMDVTQSKSLAGRTVDELHRVVDHFGPRAGKVGHRCALVAESAVHFGLMRMAAVFTETYGVDTRVFKTVEGAVEWLNRDPVMEVE